MIHLDNPNYLRTQMLQAYGPTNNYLWLDEPFTCRCGKMVKDEGELCAECETSKLEDCHE